MQRLFQSDGGWTHAVYLAAMFAMAMWRRDAIVNWGLFRLSYMLYAAGLVLPPIVIPFLPILSSSRSMGNDQVFTYVLANALGPALFAGAVICGLGSVMPKRSITYSAAPPSKHPLD